LTKKLFSNKILSLNRFSFNSYATMDHASKHNSNNLSSLLPNLSSVMAPSVRAVVDLKKIELHFPSPQNKNLIEHHQDDLIKVLEAYGLRFNSKTSAQYISNVILSALLTADKIDSNELLDFYTHLKFFSSAEIEAIYKNTGEATSQGVSLKCQQIYFAMPEDRSLQTSLQIQIGILAEKDSVNDSSEAWKIDKFDPTKQFMAPEMEEDKALYLALRYDKSSGKEALIVSAVVNPCDDSGRYRFDAWAWSDYFLSKLNRAVFARDLSSWQLAPSESPTGLIFSNQNCHIEVSCVSEAAGLEAQSKTAVPVTSPAANLIRIYQLPELPDCAFDRISHVLNMPSLAELIKASRSLAFLEGVSAQNLLRPLLELGGGKIIVEESVALSTGSSISAPSNIIKLENSIVGRLSLLLSPDLSLSISFKPSANSNASAVNWRQFDSVVSEFPKLSEEERQIG